MQHPVLVDIGQKKVSLKEIPITSNKFLIGRGLHNGCIIEDVDVSRTHCVFEQNNGEWTILDKSSNGTWLNGRLLDKTKRHKLTTGDIVGLSETVKFVFKMNLSSNDRTIDHSTKKALSDDDILNMAESVIADVEAFQAEYGSERFDETVFSNMDTNNSEASNFNQQNSTTSVNSGNLNNVNAGLQTICAVGPINIHQPTVLNIIQHPLGPTCFQPQEVSSLNIIQQRPSLSNVGQASGPSHVQLPLVPNVDSSSAASSIVPPHSVVLAQPVVSSQPQSVEQPTDSSQKSTGQQNNLEYVEDELQCTICTEMFVQAVTLSCSHTFCKHCISQWQKNQSFCPICRAKITMQFSTRVVDNFIEKVLENASEEMKQHRRELLEQRQAASVPPPPASSSTTTATTSNSNTTGTRREAQDPPIEISSGEDNTDEDEYDDDDNMSYYSGSDWERDYDDDDWFDYNGLPGQYYGGYGHCFACGQRGHWANGCPNKRR